MESVTLMRHSRMVSWRVHLLVMMARGAVLSEAKASRFAIQVSSLQE